jgi:hypothetical protein
MIGYDDLLAHNPPSLPKPDHDQWFTDHEYDIDALIRVGRELADHKLAGLADGARLNQDDLTLALISAFLFGVELTIRCERDEVSA